VSNLSHSARDSSLTWLRRQVAPATEALEVAEGESATLTARQLSVATAGVVVNYTLVEAARHGQLNLLDAGRRQPLRRNVTSFTSDDVVDQRLVYTHDDTESSSDRFAFVAASLDADDAFQLLGAVDIRVRMKNDNAPVRLLDRVLHVVTNEQRVLDATILR